MSMNRDFLIPTGTKIKKIWENPNPTSSFSPQTIQLNLSQYDAVYIVPVSSSRSFHPGVLVQMRIANFTEAYLYQSNAKIAGRGLSLVEDGIQFDEGYKYDSYGGSKGTDNSVAVPFAIYGIVF